MDTIYINFDDIDYKNLEFKNGFLDFYNKYVNRIKFTMVTKGTSLNFKVKKKWIEENISNDIPLIVVNEKKEINMFDCVQIGTDINELNTNAQIKILYGNLIHSYNDVLIANTWEQIDDIINFYLEYDYKTLTKIR